MSFGRRTEMPVLRAPIRTRAQASPRTALKPFWPAFALATVAGFLSPFLAGAVLTVAPVQAATRLYGDAVGVLLTLASIPVAISILVLVAVAVTCADFALKRFQRASVITYTAAAGALMMLGCTLATSTKHSQVLANALVFSPAGLVGGAVMAWRRGKVSVS